MTTRQAILGQWVVGGLIFLLIVFILITAFTEIHWVGSTDLEVEFVVTDADGEPIPGAVVETDSEGGLYREQEPRQFSLVTGPDGRGAYVCRDSMCFGTDSVFRDTFVVHLPWWRFRVSASGCEATDLIDLNVPEYVRAVRRSGPRTTELTMPVKLRRNPD